MECVSGKEEVEGAVGGLPIVRESPIENLGASSGWLTSGWNWLLGRESRGRGMETEFHDYVSAHFEQR